jgi:hypothetical protein
LNIVITPPSDEEALALIKNKGAIIDAALKSAAPSDVVPEPLQFTCGATAMQSVVEGFPELKGLKERDTAFESLSREAIDNGDYTPLADVIREKRETMTFKIAESPDPEGDERRRKMLDDLIEKTKAAQQRNAERLVRERAYFLWEDAGCPDGRDVEFWLAAEKQFLAWTRQICAPACGPRGLAAAMT